MSGGILAWSSGVKSASSLLSPEPLLLPPTQLRDAAAAPDEPTATAPASPSTDETMSHQLGARGNDRNQHQLLECLRCNFIAQRCPTYMPSTTGNIAAVENETSQSQLNSPLAVKKNIPQQAGRNDEKQRYPSFVKEPFPRNPFASRKMKT